MFCLSFVVVTVKARLAGLDPRLEQAAMDLYANEWQTFWRVTFPLVFPGILSAALLSFSLSFDDFIITNLNAGQDADVPDVRLGRRAARHPAADQRRRHGDVRCSRLTLVIAGGRPTHCRRSEPSPAPDLRSQHPEALSRTVRRICSISSNCAWSQISGGASWTTGSPRSSARQ